MLSDRGGIGRHAALRALWLLGLGSSSLLGRTNNFMDNVCNNVVFERASNDLRLGLPVLFNCERKKYLIATIENLTNEILSLYNKIGYEIIISPARVKLLRGKEIKYPLRIRPKHTLYSIDEVINLSLHSDTLFSSAEECCGLESDLTIIKFIKSAQLMPFVMVAEVNTEETTSWCKFNNIITIEHNEVLQRSTSMVIREICKVPLILQNVEKAIIITYRCFAHDHHAIVIGDPLSQSAPLVRIHSSCYTGDLLDSLTCDCGGQLKSAIQFMSQNNGGILLYLSQEGRGIGLTNKLRAYFEQMVNNLDTVDANRSLGFEGDERDFTVAANILKQLGINEIKLITNSTDKMFALKQNGISVVSHIPSVIKYNKYNMHYLNTKFNKLGHIKNY